MIKKFFHKIIQNILNWVRKVMAELTTKLNVNQNNVLYQCASYTTAYRATPVVRPSTAEGAYYGEEYFEGGSCMEIDNNGVTAYLGLWPKTVSGGTHHSPLTVTKNGIEYWVETQVDVPQAVKLILRPDPLGTYWPPVANNVTLHYTIRRNGVENIFSLSVTQNEISGATGIIDENYGSYAILYDAFNDPTYTPIDFRNRGLTITRPTSADKATGSLGRIKLRIVYPNGTEDVVLLEEPSKTQGVQTIYKPNDEEMGPLNIYISFENPQESPLNVSVGSDTSHRFGGYMGATIYVYYVNDQGNIISSSYKTTLNPNSYSINGYQNNVFLGYFPSGTSSSRPWYWYKDENNQPQCVQGTSRTTYYKIPVYQNNSTIYISNSGTVSPF